MKDRFIVACQDYFVKQRAQRAQRRQIRETLSVEAIAPHLKELGEVIARSENEHKPVRIPALNCAEWGHVLRTLEVSRALA